MKDEELIPINVKNIKNEDPVVLPKGNIKITKQWLDSKGNVVAHGDYTGKLFTLYKDGKELTSGSPVNGILEFNDLTPGTYKLQRR